MTVTISYEALKNFLIEEYQYTQEEAIHTLARLRTLDPEMQAMLVRYWQQSKLVSKSPRGDLVQKLVKYRNYNPIASILFVSDMARHYNEIKWSLMHAFDIRQTSDAEKAQLLELARKNCWDFSSAPDAASVEDFVLET